MPHEENESQPEPTQRVAEIPNACPMREFCARLKTEGIADKGVAGQTLLNAQPGSSVRALAAELQKNLINPLAAESAASCLAAEPGGAYGARAASSMGVKSLDNWCALSPACHDGFNQSEQGLLAQVIADLPEPPEGYQPLKGRENEGGAAGADTEAIVRPVLDEVVQEYFEENGGFLAHPGPNYTKGNQRPWYDDTETLRKREWHKEYREQHREERREKARERKRGSSR